MKKRCPREPVSHTPGWSVRRPGGGRFYHVIPNADAKAHFATPNCPCKPKKDYEYDIWVHSAWDRREVIEQLSEDR